MPLVPVEQKPKPTQTAKRVKRIRKPKGITIRATVGVDVGQHALNLDCAKAVTLEDGVYDVTFRKVE